VASVLTSLYPATTVVLAVTLLREHTNTTQRLGLTLAAATLVLLTGAVATNAQVQPGTPSTPNSPGSPGSNTPSAPPMAGSPAPTDSPMASPEPSASGSPSP